MSEIRHLREVATPSSTDPTVETASVVPPPDVERTDYTRGIYQSIGIAVPLSDCGLMK